ncbi:uncharacterized protein LOC127121751 [Lathyrus oleraceus]|uniref:uncharacterized protein LOC127121751 n=1 Tax=Pisum sativum TaxID=3888 RepID=UPI0021CE1066|nr:uncharacterized protein LOC127121751 [Pisum sativum]
MEAMSYFTRPAFASPVITHQLQFPQEKSISGIHIKTYKPHGREVRDVHVTSDDSKLCSCGGDRQVFYWDVATGRVIRKFRGHDGEVNGVKFNEYSSVVVSAGYDQSLRTWDCRSHSTEPIQVIDTFADSVMSVCLTKTEIIGRSVDGTVRTFDIRIGREISDSFGQSVNCISKSNDGNCILAGCLDSTVRLLDRTTGELLQEYKGHTIQSYKLDCCLTNTDAHVTGGSEDGFVYFWDLVDASVVSKFRAHASVVTSVSYHPKENCMITSSVDGTTREMKDPATLDVSSLIIFSGNPGPPLELCDRDPDEGVKALKSSTTIVLHPGRNTIALDLPPQKPGSYVLGVLTGQIGQLRFRSHGVSKLGPAESDDVMSYEKPVKPILKVSKPRALVDLDAAISSASSKSPQGGKGSVRLERITKIRQQLKTFLSEATGCIYLAFKWKSPPSACFVGFIFW